MGQFLLPADHRQGIAGFLQAQDLPDPPAGQFAHRYRLRLALDPERWQFVPGKAVRHPAVAGLAHQDPVPAGRLHQPRRQVHRVADGGVLLPAGGAHVPDKDPPAVDADMLLVDQGAFTGQPLQGQGAEEGPLLVVLAGHRRAKEGDRLATLVPHLHLADVAAVLFHRLKEVGDVGGQALRRVGGLVVNPGEGDEEDGDPAVLIDQHSPAGDQPFVDGGGQERAQLLDRDSLVGCRGQG